MAGVYDKYRTGMYKSKLKILEFSQNSSKFSFFYIIPTHLYYMIYLKVRMSFIKEVK
jgi:hypothetical protein